MHPQTATVAHSMSRSPAVRGVLSFSPQCCTSELFGAIWCYVNLLRGRLKTSDRLQSSQHEPNHCNVNECLGSLWQTLVVCLESSPSTQPRKGSLDDPTPWKNCKARLAFRLSDDLEPNLSPWPESPSPLLQNSSSIGSIGPHHT